MKIDSEEEKRLIHLAFHKSADDMTMEEFKEARCYLLDEFVELSFELQDCWRRFEKIEEEIKELKGE